ncbi:2'-5' RNA ligase family protein [Actinoplanes oblitus]|uniref:2'-5' RNA ligase family protein n=1 Tax=Actinoplanes oblitus TaxID=3040509 RepID=A0ABY8W6Q9_9ACTN|nr:2'-5' RNA ligase family protein [Actinoplanes oblitus]WIM92645.1 2'-5' RNA ligase family protein [Actinoplanes oblitus]
MEPLQSALIVPIPEAEPAVAGLRARLDRSASWGVPAHITVIFPFLPPEQLSTPALAAVRRIAAGVPRFYLSLDKLGWFDQRVLWLSPNPAEPFRELTNRLAVRFPAAQPYGGQFAEVIPHLTVGHDQPAPALADAAAQLRERLPIRARVTALRLITGRREPGDSWQTLTDFPLG